MNGWVLYDGDCGMCTALVSRFGPVLGCYGWTPAPLQEEWVRLKLALPEEELMSEMRVLTVEDKIVGGADAFVLLASRIWWAKPFAWFSVLPGVMSVLRSGYRWIAEHRACRHGRCRI